MPKIMSVGNTPDVVVVHARKEEVMKVLQVELQTLRCADDGEMRNLQRFARMHDAKREGVLPAGGKEARE